MSAQVQYFDNPKILNSGNVIHAAGRFAGASSFSMGGSGRALDDAGISSGGTFLIAQLEQVEKKLYQPLTSVTWMRDMPIKSGGGFLSNTSNFFVNYATSGTNQNGFVTGQANDIPVMQANITKSLYPVFPWKMILRVPLMDQDRMAQAGIPESLGELLEKGLRLNWNKEMDQLTYFGIPMLSITGLVNNTSVTATSAPTNGTGTTWAVKTVQQILNDINFMMGTGWAAGNYDPLSMPNTLLLPPNQFLLLNNTIVSSAGNQSVLTYLKNNNALTGTYGEALRILPCRQCIGAGSGSTDRAVAYRYDPELIHLNITQPMYRKLTQADVKEDAYLSLYETWVGPVKMMYTQPAYYLDAI